MDRIFHTFISSTYNDLIDARKCVSDAVAKAGYVAEGMEIFPASSQRQMDFIHRVIDRCDYYILIVAGRYGSISENGKSYTELEYEYALKKGIPVLAFLHSDIGSISEKFREKDSHLSQRLQDFVDLVSSSAMVDFWSSPNELATKALAALSHARQTHPGIGWLRADRAASEDVLSEINNLRKENENLAQKLSKLSVNPILSADNLSQLDDKFKVRYSLKKESLSSYYEYSMEIGLRDIFKIISPTYRVSTNTYGIEASFSNYIKNETTLASSKDSVIINSNDKNQLLIHFEALGLMSATIYPLKNGGSGVFHQLTPAGEKLMLELNAAYKK